MTVASRSNAWSGCLAAALLAMVGATGAGRALAQPSGDVPYVPTPGKVVDAMLKAGRVASGDFLIDLGSGDGRIVIAAAKRFGVRGFGVDLDGGLVNTANRNAAREGVGDRATFHQRNIFDTDLGQANVITMYLLPQVNMRLRPTLLALRPGTRIVSHDFSMEDWKPDEELTIDVPEKVYGPPSSKVYLWIVPARAEGRWQWKVPVTGGEHTVDLVLEQSFQVVRGRVTVAGRTALLVNPRLAGDQLSFAVVDDYTPRMAFTGRVGASVIEGTLRGEGASAAPLRWTAQRVGGGAK